METKEYLDLIRICVYRVDKKIEVCKVKKYFLNGTNTKEINVYGEYT